MLSLAKTFGTITVICGFLVLAVGGASALAAFAADQLDNDSSGWFLAAVVAVPSGSATIAYGALTVAWAERELKAGRT